MTCCESQAQVVKLYKEIIRMEQAAKDLMQHYESLSIEILKESLYLAQQEKALTDKSTFGDLLKFMKKNLEEE